MEYLGIITTQAMEAERFSMKDIQKTQFLEMDVDECGNSVLMTRTGMRDKLPIFDGLEIFLEDVKLNGNCTS